MFTSNPWTLYAVIVTVTAVIYYAFVGWNYYGKEVGDLLRGKQRASKELHFYSGQRTTAPKVSEDSNTENILTFEEQRPAWQNEELIAQAEDLLEHLSSEIHEAHQKNYDKRDVIQMLQMILRDYLVLKDTPFHFAVNNRIDAECAKYGSVRLSESDKREVWNMV